MSVSKQVKELEPGDMFEWSAGLYLVVGSDGKGVRRVPRSGSDVLAVVLKTGRAGSTKPWNVTSFTGNETVLVFTEKEDFK